MSDREQHDPDSLDDLTIDELSDADDRDDDTPDVLAFGDAKACENRRPIDGRWHFSADDRNQAVIQFRSCLQNWIDRCELIEDSEQDMRESLAAGEQDEAKAVSVELKDHRGFVKADWAAVCYWQRQMNDFGMMLEAKQLSKGSFRTGRMFRWYMGDGDDDGGQAA